jgi:ribosomal protein S18 acetylase RimI-like enzyme
MCVADLVVLAAYRRRGIGRRCLRMQRRSSVRRTGTRTLRLGVLAKIRVAAELYRRMGFSDYHVQLVMRLS